MYETRYYWMKHQTTSGSTTKEFLYTTSEFSNYQSLFVLR